MKDEVHFVCEDAQKNLLAYFHYSVWLVKKLPGFRGITFGKHVYFQMERSEIVKTLSDTGKFLSGDIRSVKHEMTHVKQYKDLGFLGFLLTYVRQWIKHGFSYMKIDLEIEARANEKKDLEGDFIFKVIK